ncbi:hypothetical protein FRC07_009779, partial [Ceratobasidium sp. 392]
PIETVVEYLITESGIPELTADLSRAQSIVGPIVSGGFADVYKVTSWDGSHLAVKCLRQQGNKGVKHTARELHYWSRIQHPGVLQLGGLAMFRGSLAMVSPWIERGNVASVIRNEPHVDRYDLVRTGLREL